MLHPVELRARLRAAQQLPVKGYRFAASVPESSGCPSSIKAAFAAVAYHLKRNYLLASLGLMARNSQALAVFQSRETVAVDIPRAAAVSSAVMPPKYLISTILLLRASRIASSFSASSRAIRSAACL